MRMLKPKPLKRGSRIAIVSPSWGGSQVFPWIQAKGLDNLREAFGFDLVEFPTTRMSPEALYANPRARAEDLNRAFADPSIEAIFSTIGGFESIRILPHLDVDTALRNPKILMGYSDTVTLLSYLNWNGLVTFHGPSVMSGWAQMHNFPGLADQYASALLTSRAETSLLPFPAWSTGYPDWAQPETAGQVLDLRPNTTGFEWIQGDQPVRGPLWGGCIEVLDFLKGTDFWPPKDFWRGRILMIETSEEKPLPQSVVYSLRNFGMQGILNQIAGLLIGRAKDYTEAETIDLHRTVKSIVRDEFDNPDLPIVGRLDFGHTDPNAILPLGIELEIDPTRKTLRFTESFFQP